MTVWTTKMIPVLRGRRKTHHPTCATFCPAWVLQAPWTMCKVQAHLCQCRAVLHLRVLGRAQHSWAFFQLMTTTSTAINDRFAQRPVPSSNHRQRDSEAYSAFIDSVARPLIRGLPWDPLSLLRANLSRVTTMRILIPLVHEDDEGAIREVRGSTPSYQAKRSQRNQAAPSMSPRESGRSTCLAARMTLG